MYEQNEQLCKALDNIFTSDVCRTIYGKNYQEMWNLWNNTCGKSMKRFFAMINIYDKKILYSWIGENSSIIIKDYNMKDYTEFEFTKELCDNIFWRRSNKIWDIWIGLANEDVTRFLSILNVKDKYQLLLWLDSSS